MGKPKKTKEQFIAEARNAHGDKFDYSMVEYKNNRTPVLIICPDHGLFLQRPYDHVRGVSGCPECGKKICKDNNGRRLDTIKFVEKAKAKYGDKYSYGKVDYKDSVTPVTITCPIHGDFQIAPALFLYKHGCSKCTNHYHRTNDDFVTELKSLYGDKYGYDKIDFKTIKSPVIIGCRIHGNIKCNPQRLLKGAGCPKCGRDRMKKPIYGVGINDIDLAHGTKCYKHWVGVLQRCYSDIWHSKYPTYKDCTICDEWKFLSNFKKWFDENYKEGYHLDKDILVKGNKVYSPSTCAFIPPRINLLHGRSQASRGEFPVGVHKRGNRYVASVTLGDSHIKSLGYFITPIDAFRAYKEAKQKIIKEVAQEYYDRGEIIKRVYDALMRYEVEITD